MFAPTREQRIHENNKRIICGGEQAHNIREECERLFCEAMKVAFLGEEGKHTYSGSFEMGAATDHEDKNLSDSFVNKTSKNSIESYIEVWDYVGGCDFRGFVGGYEERQSLFVFLEAPAIYKDLRKSLMAVIDLAEAVLHVPNIVICLDRTITEDERKALLKSLSWVGFTPVTLKSWSDTSPIVSDRWFFLGMEL